MTSLLLVMSALMAADGASGSQYRDSASIERSRRPTLETAFHELHQQIRDLLKRESQAKDAASRAGAIRGMCALHGQIVSDPRFSTSDKLKQYRAQLWSRLKRVQSDLEAQQARGRDAADAKQAAEDIALLRDADPVQLAAAEILASSLSLLDQTQGGPGYLMALGGRAVRPDHGRELVELIERTINPAFWDVNGGPGTIVYYAPLQCLVVRGTTEVHGHVGGVLGGLREAGR